MAISDELKAAVADVQRRLTEEQVEWVMAFDDGVHANFAAGASNAAMALWGAQYSARAVACVERTRVPG